MHTGSALTLNPAFRCAVNGLIIRVLLQLGIRRYGCSLLEVES